MMNENEYTSEAFVAAAELTPTTYFLKLNELIDENRDRVFCFVEGINDMKYYYGRVSSICKRDPCEIVCGCKDNVIIAHKEVSLHPEMSRYTIRYFVDADFDDNTNLSKDICITEGYSIENYYGLDNTVAQMLHVAYCIGEKKDLQTQLMQLYTGEKAKILPAIALFNAWYAALHDLEDWKTGRLIVRLEQNFPSKLISYAIGGPYGEYTIDDIYTLYPDVPRLSLEVIKKKEEWIKQNLEMRIRGKYVMQILRVFIQYINDKSGKAHPRYFTNGKHIMSECVDTMLNDMSQFAYTPDSLIEYIRLGKRQ